MLVMEYNNCKSNSIFLISHILVESAHLLHDAERKVLAPCAGRHTRYRVEGMAVVDSQQSKDGKEDTGTNADRSTYLEGIEIAEVIPRITTFGECQHEHRGLVIQHHGVAQFQLVFIVNRTTRVAGYTHVRAV